MKRPHLRFGRRGAAVLALIVAAAAVVIVIVSTSSSGKGNGANGAVGSTASGSATVERRNLIATDTESGTLSYAGQQTVYNRLSGTVTWLPSVGSVIHAGKTLFTVDNKPVLLMDGRVPAFRDLTASDLSGPDVYELNANLVKLGYNPDGIVVNGTWQYATTAGVDALQQHLGETQTGTLTLGQVVFLPGPQLIASQTGTLGSTAVSDPQAGSSSAANPLFVDFNRSSTSTSTTATPSTTTSTTTTGTSTGTTTTGTGGTLPGGETLQALIALLKAETAELQRAIAAARGSQTGAGSSGGGRTSTGGGGAPTSAGSGNSGGGSGGAGAVAILTTSSTKLVVTVDLNASLQSEAKLHEAVTVEMPNGATVGGRVTQISSVAQSSPSSSGGGGSSPGGGSSSTVPITITLDKRARGAGLDQAAVSVNFQQAKARDVLSVPVTALLATSGSSFAVKEAAAPHRLLPVTTELFAAGYVEISGPGIHPGLQVTDSQG